MVDQLSVFVYRYWAFQFEQEVIGLIFVCVSIVFVVLMRSEWMSSMLNKNYQARFIIYRLHRLKSIAKSILGTLTKLDRVNIVLSRSPYWDTDGTSYIYLDFIFLPKNKQSNWKTNDWCLRASRIFRNITGCNISQNSTSVIFRGYQNIYLGNCSRVPKLYLDKFNFYLGNLSRVPQFCLGNLDLPSKLPRVLTLMLPPAFHDI